jgi:hypothetical protein
LRSQLELEVRGSATELLQQLQNVIDELIVLTLDEALDEVAADLVEVELANHDSSTNLGRTAGKFLAQ